MSEQSTTQRNTDDMNDAILRAVDRGEVPADAFEEAEWRAAGRWPPKQTTGRMGVADRDWMRICFAAGAVVHGAAAECWFCKRMRPPGQHINITASAAGSVPSTFRPVCQECANV